ncbi:polysaccharide deacetylase family protein [Verrucomicrobium sp. BvORR106]|uniref:polysaccharide deacetylase family protein n=1 Tax=Verrucomicrobium sp. BvORR106 TaxID=1403819 RepID=UPI000692516B|nr:polysaccharide deacetylase family protein [Verrucomicrobium sp. BvORR106]
MIPSLWLGIVLSVGLNGNPAVRRFPDLAEAAPASSSAARPSAILPGVEIFPGLRDTDHFEIAKVPPPSVKASYSSVPMTQPYIAITFDDGPHATNTPRLLDILAERNIKATFFVVGRNVREYPAILRRIIAEGHEVGNHSWSHMALSTLTPDKVRQELGKTHDAVLQAAGYQMRLMRPPYGATNLRVKQICFQEFHYPSIIWTVDPLDWKQPGSSVVAQHIVAGTRSGAIILAHDIHAATIDAMPDTLDTLLAKGYHFVTVSQLLNLGEKYPVTSTVPVAIPVPEPEPTLPIPAAATGTGATLDSLPGAGDVRPVTGFPGDAPIRRN